MAPQHISKIIPYVIKEINERIANRAGEITKTETDINCGQLYFWRTEPISYKEIPQGRE